VGRHFLKFSVRCSSLVLYGVFKGDCIPPTSCKPLFVEIRNRGYRAKEVVFIFRVIFSYTKMIDLFLVLKA